jgi:hypothetical protein
LNRAATSQKSPLIERPDLADAETCSALLSGRNR